MFTQENEFDRKVALKHFVSNSVKNEREEVSGNLDDLCTAIMEDIPPTHTFNEQHNA